MSKKPVLLEAAMGGSATSNVVSMPEAAPAKKVETSDKLTVYLPKKAAKRIKQMALDNDVRVNDLLQEAVDLMLAKHGEKSLQEYR